MSEKKLSIIKSYVKAKSPESLKALMLRNNIELNAYHAYTIVHDGSLWFAWFDYDASDLVDKETAKAVNNAE